MEYFVQDVVSEGPEKKKSSKFAFANNKGFKRSMALIIILTFLSIIYTLITKVSSPNLNQLFQKLFSEMKDEISNSTMIFRKKYQE